MVRCFFLLLIPFAFSGCRKCVQCEIKLKQSQDVIGFVDEFCGTGKQVEAEEERLLDDHTCIECIIITGFGPTTSGVHCGDRDLTDSIQADWDAGAFDLGTTAECTYFRDTAKVICVLNQ